MRTYKKKTDRAGIPEDKVKAAIEDILKGEKSIRQAAQYYGINRSTLSIRIKGFKSDMVEVPLGMGLKKADYSSKYSSRQIFTMEEENLLEDYLIKSSKLNYGLTMEAMRELAYNFAVNLGRNMPINWSLKKKAGEDWAGGFIKRHRNLSLRKPENTSLARNVSFTRENMDIFYDNLEEMLNMWGFQPSNIWNIDETGLSTVLQAPKVLAATGVKQVGQTVSNERGEQITVTGIVSAAGQVIPPVYLFPRKRAHEEYMNGSPDGSIAIFNGSGWMDENTFLEVLKHVATHTAPSKENPILIVLDNHSSHATLKTINFCREKGIHMISFPPHTTHRAQPLDISVFGPFKTRCKSLFNAWLNDNPGKRITIHNIVQVSSDAIKNAFSEKNIRSGFIKSGICPLDRSSLFREYDALFQNATSTTQSKVERSSLDGASCLKSPASATSLPVFHSDNSGFSASSSLEDLRPIPKPLPSLGKRGLKSTIITGSPEKRRKEELQKKKEEKQKKKNPGQNPKNKN